MGAGKPESQGDCLGCAGGASESYLAHDRLDLEGRIEGGIEGRIEGGMHLEQDLARRPPRQCSNLHK